MSEQLEKGKITVAIPTVNRRDLLPLTVKTALSQSYKNIEVIISNNASTDDTDLVLQQFTDSRVRTFKQPTRLDMVSSWNFCLSKATGEWFILLSDDDLLEPKALEELLRPLTANQAAMSFSSFILLDGVGVDGSCFRSGPKLSSGASFIRNHLSRRFLVMPSGVLGRTAVYRALGGFPDIGTTSDLGLRLLLATTGAVACPEAPLLRYRIHGGNLSGNFDTVIASHQALEAWARERSELEPYLDAISAYVWRGITGFGVRGALVGDAEGTHAAVKAIESGGASVWRKWAARFAILAAGTAAFRAVMAIRDRRLWDSTRRV